jgi:hypothetical protein
MAKKKTQRKTLEEFFYFKDSNEFVIFMVWGLFVSAFLLNLLNK